MSEAEANETADRVEVAAWNKYAGSNETIASYTEDLNSGAAGLRPTSVRAFHAAWDAAWDEACENACGCI